MLAILAGDRRRVVEVGTAIGYSTLWMALALPAGGTIVTIDPDRDANRPCPGVLARAPASPDGGSRRRERPGARRLRGGSPELAGPFDLAFIDALKEEYSGYVERSGHGSRRARSSSRTTCCGAGGRPAPGRRATATAPTRCASSAARCRPTRAFETTILPDRRRAPRRGPPRLIGDGVDPRARPAVRDAARARGNARARPRAAAGRDDRGRLDRGRPTASDPRAGPAGLRFARNGAYAPARDGPGRWRRGRDDPAGERRRETDSPARAASSRSGPSRSGRRSSRSWASDWPRPRTARSSASSA